MDLFYLASSFGELGYRCRLIALEGHLDPTDDLALVEPKSWQEQVVAEFDRLSAEQEKVFVSGFSLGGILGLQLASMRPVAGVVSISTFVRPRYPRLTSRLLSAASRLSLHRWPRWLQTTDKTTKAALPHLKSLPPKTAIKVIDLGARAPEFVRNLSCRVILFHSLDDRVADYWAAVQVARLNRSVAVVTFASLNHFLQFDVPTQALRNTMLAYLGLDDSGEDELWAPLEERFEQRSEDARHWADMVFRLILAFFTIFGALLFFTLEDVLAQTERASTFLLAYGFVLSLYVQLVALYFFYVVRVDVFLKLFLEPLTGIMGWAAFRSNPYASGTTSATMTRLTALPVVGFPLAGGLVALVYAVFTYWERDFGPRADNAFHQVFGGVAFIMWLWATRAAIALNTYTTRNLYRLMPLDLPSKGIARAVDELYRSVEPGVVDPTPPPDFTALRRADLA